MKERFYSLDVFRGATVAFMITVNNPGSWDHIYPPLDHAKWNGCTPTDLVFPFFLFAVGNAMAFVIPRLQQAGTSVFMKKVIKRTLLIFLIGLFLNWSPFFKWDHDQLVFKVWTNIRILGVLQRIALCYFFASLIVYFMKPKGAIITCLTLLLGYWALCYFSGTPGDPYSINGWFGTQVDKSILGETHMYHGEGLAFDPEGFASVFAAIVQVIFGYFAGRYIQQKGKTYEMLSHLLIAGCIMVFVGICWDEFFPLNKKIWTSSYTVYTTGLALMVLSVAIFFIEFKHKKGVLSRFFDAFGKNPLFVFVLSGFLPRILGLIRISDGIMPDGSTKYTSPFGWFYEHICKPVFSNENNSSLLYALIMITFYWLIAYWLDKKKIYVKV